MKKSEVIKNLKTELESKRDKYTPLDYHLTWNELEKAIYFMEIMESGSTDFNNRNVDREIMETGLMLSFVRGLTDDEGKSKGENLEIKYQDDGLMTNSLNMIEEVTDELIMYTF
jgi:hypothetical protein